MPMRLTRQLLRTPFQAAPLTRSYHITSTSRHTLIRQGLPQTSLIQPTSLLSRPRQNPFTAVQAQRALSTSPDVVSTASPGLIESAIVTTENLISSIHYTSGLPWYLTIPLLALSLNLVTRWPITVYQNGLNQRRAELKPILSVAYRKITMRILTEAKKNDPLAGPAELYARSMKEFTKYFTRLYSAYGVQRRKDFLSLGILPVWLLNIEALRRLSGTSGGLLGLIFSSSSENNKDTPPATSPTASSDMLDNTAVAAPTPTDFAPDLTTTAQQITEATTAFTGDPTLMTGGCLWFMDLTAPDPYQILPVTLSVLMLYNVLPHSKAGIRALFGVPEPGDNTRVPPGRGTLALQRVLVLLALAVGPMTAQLPAAIHLYWVSSAGITLGMKNLADRLWPIPKGDKIKPCKRMPTIPLPKREKKAEE